MAFTFHVSPLTRSMTSMDSSVMPETVLTFGLAAASAADSSATPKTRYGISTSVTFPLASIVSSRSEYASSTLTVAITNSFLSALDVSQGITP